MPARFMNCSEFSAEEKPLPTLAPLACASETNESLSEPTICFELVFMIVSAQATTDTQKIKSNNEKNSNLLKFCRSSESWSTFNEEFAGALGFLKSSSERDSKLTRKL